MMQKLNAFLFGWMGMPVNRRDCKTCAVFHAEQVQHGYEESIRDGATMPLLLRTALGGTAHLFERKIDILPQQNLKSTKRFGF